MTLWDLVGFVPPNPHKTEWNFRKLIPRKSQLESIT